MKSSQPRAVATAFFTELYAGDPAAAIAKFCSPDYVEHQATARFEASGLQAYIRQRRDNYPGHSFTIHRTIAQRDLVFLHVEERLSTTLVCARGELMRVSGDRVAEHWSAHVIDKAPRRNPHTSFDGPAVDAGTDVASRFADRFNDLDRRGFGEFELDAFACSRTARYIQHSATGADTVRGLVNVLMELRRLGIVMDLAIKRTICEGDFLVSHRLYRTRPPYPEFRLINVFDLFRMTEQGQADEHWDIMEEVADEADLPKLFWILGLEQAVADEFERGRRHIEPGLQVVLDRAMIGRDLGERSVEVRGIRGQKRCPRFAAYGGKMRVLVADPDAAPSMREEFVFEVDR